MLCFDRLAHALYVQEVKETHHAREESRSSHLRELLSGPVVGRAEGVGEEGESASASGFGEVQQANGSVMKGPSFANVMKVRSSALDFIIYSVSICL